MKSSLDQSQALQKKSVIEELLEANHMTVTQLAELLNVSRETIWRYRAGKVPFKLDMQQIKELDRLLQKTGRRLADLPPDWILDK